MLDRTMTVVWIIYELDGKCKEWHNRELCNPSDHHVKARQLYILWQQLKVQGLRVTIGRKFKSDNEHDSTAAKIHVLTSSKNFISLLLTFQNYHLFKTPVG